MKEILLTKNKKAIVDDDMHPIISKYKWCAREGRHTFYSYKQFTISPKNKTLIAMHHVVMGHPRRGLVVDHINGNGLDNRRENLRIITYRENSSNFRIDKKIKKYVGVHYNKKCTKRPWRAELRSKGKDYCLGYFTNEEEAHQAYINKIKEIENVRTWKICKK